MEAVALPKELFEKIGQYLISRPYAEVAGLVAEVNKDAKAITLHDQKEETNE